MLSNWKAPYKVNLGCGLNKNKDLINIDKNPSVEPDLVVDLEKYPWPFPDNSVEEVFATHFLEHISDLSSFMNEVWRVCQNKAKVTIQCPYYTSVRAYADPTHVRYMSEANWLYFSQEWLHQMGQYIKYDNIKADFRILGFNYVWNKAWDGKSDEAKEYAKTHYFNVVDDFFSVLEAIKEKEPKKG